MNDSSALDSAVVSIRMKHGDVVTPTVTSGEPIGSNDMLMSYFKLNPNDVSGKTTKQLTEIYEWAKNKAGSEEEMDILGLVRDVTYRLSSSNVADVHRYVKLRKMAEEAEARAKAMEL